MKKKKTFKKEKKGAKSFLELKEKRGTFLKEIWKNSRYKLIDFYNYKKKENRKIRKPKFI